MIERASVNRLMRRSVGGRMVNGRWCQEGFVRRYSRGVLPVHLLKAR
jgi:hypothetical protein